MKKYSVTVTNCRCEACGWEGKVADLLPDNVGGFVPGDDNEHVYCPSCGTEGWIHIAK